MLDALTLRIERDGAQHAQAMAELFARLRATENSITVANTRRAMAGWLVMSACTAVGAALAALLPTIVGKIWP